MRVSTFEEEMNLYLAANQYGIEPVSSITKRIIEFMESLNLGLSVAVTHADVIRCAVVHALGINDDEFASYGIVPETATMTVVKVRHGKFTVVTIGSPRATDTILQLIRKS